MKQKKAVRSESLSTENNFLSLKLQLIILFVTSILFYANTISNEYALDDGLVIAENPFTLQGIGGIGDIFTHDSYYGFYQQFGKESELTGGRYRPLSIITFAIEYEFFRLNPQVSHAVNVLLYAITALLLLIFLNKYLFRNMPVLAFLTALLFIIHPIHTEVVANIKGRDELMSLLFLIGAMIYLFKYHLFTKNIWHIGAAAFLYFLALMSKENGITFLAIIPLALYCFTEVKWKKTFGLTLPFIAMALLYLMIRTSIVGFGAEQMTDIMNDPFAFASANEKYATITYILLLYLKLLFFPHPLSYDYGFSQIPYKEFADPLVIFSILLHLGMLIFAIIKLRKGAVLPFAILFYLITLSIVSNIFIDLGGTMGERLIYHSSLGFVMAIAYLIIKLFSRINLPLSNLKKPAGWALIGIIFIAAGYKTIARNAEWESNATLFIADVEAVPNSVKANVAAATAYISQAEKAPPPEARKYYELAEQHLLIARELYPNFTDIYLNLGVIYYHMEDFEKMKAAWGKAAELQPGHPKLKEYEQFMPEKYLELGIQAGAAGNIQDAVTFLRKAVKHEPENAEAWYNLGGALFTMGKLEEAKAAFDKAIQLNPNHVQAQQGLNAVNSKLQ